MVKVRCPRAAGASVIQNNNRRSHDIDPPACIRHGSIRHVWASNCRLSHPGADCLWRGGGGEPTHDLAVAFNYGNANNVELTQFKAEDLPAPQADGLEGHAPHFALVSGNLPEGVTLNPDTGVIGGRPLVNTKTKAVVRLTVPGYKGSLDVDVNVTVKPLWVMYSNTSVDIQRGLPLEVNKPDMPTYDDAVKVSFATWPAGTALPPGLTLNKATGALAGTLTVAGNYAVTLVATAKYGSRSSQADARVDYFVSPIVDMGFGYDVLFGAPGAPASITPFKTLLPGDSLTDYRIVPGLGTGVPGMSVNVTNGVVSGSLPSTPGEYDMTVEATFKRGSIVETRRGQLQVYVE